MTSEYYKVFQKRLTSDGFSYKEQIQSLARRNFENYINETPTSVIIQYENESYKVSIVENKQDEYRLSKQMLSSVYDYFPIGSLIYWEYYNPKDAPENYWIVWRIQQNSIQDHNVSYISRCNHKLKWIDEEGIRHEQYVYEFSSKENMIRATFKSRVQEIIASEPNKFMEIIMPFTEDIKREQRFIVDGEAWYVIEFDSSSVDGITYITLGEDRKDLQQDLLIAKGDEEDLANYQNEYKNIITLLQDSPIIIAKYSYYTIVPYYYKDGLYIDDAVFNFYVNNELVETGTSFREYYEENTNITIKLAENEKIFNKIRIETQEDIEEEYVYNIIGDNNIKWGKTAAYSLIEKDYTYINKVYDANYSISDNSLATLEVEDGIVYITANNKRKTGKLILTASGENFSVEKQIDIMSLW